MGGAPYKSAKEGGGYSFKYSAFNHERAPMSCLHALEANNGVTCGAHCISYVH